jgi:phosphoribosylanthranilate isomerase
MRVKVCGMTRLDQLRQLDEWGVEFAGLIFYPKSPRYIKKFHLSAIDLKREKLGINTVGVFVNETLEEILRIVDTWRLGMVQLHGDESPKFCEQVSNHVTTVKAFRIGEGDNLEWKIRPYHEFTDMYLFDNGWLGSASARNASAYGGTGRKFDWSQLERANVRKPFFLSGGIDPSDGPGVKAFAATQNDFFAVDVNSRFETEPGTKDMKLIRSFLDDTRP